MKNDLSGMQAADLENVGNEKILLPVNISGESVNVWVDQNAQHVTRLLNENGALVLRGFPIRGSKKLEKVLCAFFNNKLIDYNYRSTPRTKMRGHIYTSSEYHSEETIGLHNENAYSNEWAMNIAFYCVNPGDSGGATPIADSRKVLASIPQEIVEEFESRKLVYVRNYGDIDLPWSEVFQTNNRVEVEDYCNKNEIEFEWIGSQGLRTKQFAKAIQYHPETAEKLWFNQAHMFHISALSEENRQSMLNTFGKEGLPRNVYFSDGTDLDSESLRLIRLAYEKNKTSFAWQEGDLLLLDNMLFSHGREPFKGSRRVLVGMATAMNSNNQQLQKSQ